MIAPPPSVDALVTLRDPAAIARLGAAATPLWPGANIVRVALPGPRAIERVRRVAGVVAAERNRVRARAAPPQGPTPDPLREQQSALNAIRWTPPGHARVRPRVAVLDTGVDSAADLAGSIAARDARSFVPGRDPLTDPEGHGTHVAGIIAATSGNGIGIAGIADAEILPVTVADASGRATTATLVQGLRYAVSRGAQVVNISFAGSGYSAVEQAAVNDAVRAGVLVVAASGNGGAGPRRFEFPAAYRHVLAVAAVGADGLPRADSTPGPQVAVAAPGESMISTAPRLGETERYAARSGTSVAAPIVSGIAARLLGGARPLTASQLRSVILGSARDAGAPGRDDATGYGIVDLYAALRAPVPPSDGAEPDDDPQLADTQPPLLTAGGSARATVGGRTEAWSDPRDARRVWMRAGDTLDVSLTGAASTLDLDLIVWRPGAPAAATPRLWAVASSLGPSSRESLRLVARTTGSYTVEVRIGRGAGGPYRLAVRRSTGGS
ncbi:MAG: S8 family serine peptidase [Actinobacteria bacterium]|nr:S8 family serine peptidase [Actinomycetota bacterium]